MTTKDARIIETRYSGILFRSRLEARYAVFFDALEEPWEYEREGYVLEDGTPYLPDFWLPAMYCHFEIKGQVPTAEEYQKAEGLFRVTKSPVAVVNGLPGERWGTLYCYSDADATEDWGIQRVRLGVSDEGRLAFLVDGLDTAKQSLFAIPYDKSLPVAHRWMDDPALRLATERAKSERFDRKGRT